MGQVTSRDGTAIAFDRLGAGPPVILVHGALVARSEHAPLAARLASSFTVYNYDRRGRGDSGDTSPYAVEREIEDVAGLIEEAGGSAYLYGHSSGAVLALKAAARLGATNVTKLALYEAPFGSSDQEAKRAFAGYVQRMEELLAANRRGDAVALFLGDMMPPQVLEAMRQSPEWPRLEAVAHTLAYDNAVMGDASVPEGDARAATMPALVLVGGASPPFLHEAAEALLRVLPNARRRTLAGQTHRADPDVLAPLLAEFFAG